jgi:peptidoglycan/LPS O-acetylase OafA/YrhL
MIAVLLGFFALATTWRIADWLIHHDWYWTYFRLDTRLSGLVLGSVIAIGSWRLPNIVASAIGGLGLIVLIATALLMPPITGLYLTMGGIWIDVSAGMLVAALAGSEKSTLSRIFAFGPLVYLGLISYGIYLWHYLIARFVRIAVDDPATALPIIAVLSVAVAGLSYRYVEKPLRSLRAPARTAARA